MTMCRCSQTAYCRLRTFLFHPAMLALWCFMQVHSTSQDMATDPEPLLEFPETSDQIIRKLKEDETWSRNTAEAVRRGIALTSIRNEMRKAFIMQDYHRVIELAGIIKNEYPNQQLNLFYDTAAQMRLSERGEDTSIYPQLSDIAPQLPKDPPSVEDPGNTGVSPDFTPVPMLTPAPVDSTPDESSQVVFEPDDSTRGAEKDESGAKIVALVETPVVSGLPHMAETAMGKGETTMNFGKMKGIAGIILVTGCAVIVLLILLISRLRPDGHKRLEAAVVSSRLHKVIDEPLHTSRVSPGFSTEQNQDVIDDESTESVPTDDIEGFGGIGEFENPPEPAADTGAPEETEQPKAPTENTGPVPLSTGDFNLDDILFDSMNEPGDEPEATELGPVSDDQDDSNIPMSEDMKLDLEANHDETGIAPPPTGDVPLDNLPDAFVEDFNFEEIEGSKPPPPDNEQKSADESGYNADDPGGVDEESVISLEDVGGGEGDSLHELDVTSTQESGPGSAEKTHDMINLGDFGTPNPDSTTDNPDMDGNAQITSEEPVKQSTDSLADSPGHYPSDLEELTTEMQSFSIDGTVEIDLNADLPSLNAIDETESTDASPTVPPTPESALTGDEGKPDMQQSQSDMDEPFPNGGLDESRAVDTVGLGGDSLRGGGMTQDPPQEEITNAPGIGGTPPPESPNSGGSLFEREYNQGIQAFNAGDWNTAHHHLSIAAALKPDNGKVKTHLRRARANRKQTN